jgi:hypothetical protein
LRRFVTRALENLLRPVMSETQGATAPTATPRIPPPQTLPAFEAAARHQNDTRVAEERALAPSTINCHVATLEDRVNARLFQREGRRVRLFEAAVQDPHSDHFVWRADHPKLNTILALHEWLREQISE